MMSFLLALIKPTRTLWEQTGKIGWIPVIWLSIDIPALESQGVPYEIFLAHCKIFPLSGAENPRDGGKCPRASLSPHSSSKGSSLCWVSLVWFRYLQGFMKPLQSFQSTFCSSENNQVRVLKAELSVPWFTKSSATGLPLGANKPGWLCQCLLRTVWKPTEFITEIQSHLLSSAIGSAQLLTDGTEAAG